MHHIKGLFITVFRMATVVGVGWVAWKLVRSWHTGLAETAGRAIDASINSAAEKLERVAVALENGADGGVGENLGKNLDDVLMDTKKTLDTATDLVQHALHRGA